MNHFAPRLVPRIVLTPAWIRAVRGRWQLDGEIVEIREDPETGTLIVSTSNGERVSPLEVVSRGTRIGARRAKTSRRGAGT